MCLVALTDIFDGRFDSLLFPLVGEKNSCSDPLICQLAEIKDHEIHPSVAGKEVVKIFVQFSEKNHKIRQSVTENMWFTQIDHRKHPIIFVNHPQKGKKSQNLFIAQSKKSQNSSVNHEKKNVEFL